MDDKTRDELLLVYSWELVRGSMDPEVAAARIEELRLAGARYRWERLLIPGSMPYREVRDG